MGQAGYVPVRMEKLEGDGSWGLVCTSELEGFRFTSLFLWRVNKCEVVAAISDEVVDRYEGLSAMLVSCYQAVMGRGKP